MMGNRGSDPGLPQAQPEVLQRQAGFDCQGAIPLNRPAPGFVLPGRLAVVDIERHGLQGERRPGRRQAEQDECIGLAAADQASKLPVRVPEMHR
ncbi:MAG TPA: hypothetical protein VKW04_05970 [Planctomycetota bacterium]|nr:hypothetical protein [Planctomycetota bacterium]